MTVDSNGTTAKFLPTPSVRRATLFVKWRNVPDRFLPTPSARRATGRRSVRGHQSAISTHALREEGDVPPAAKSRRPAGISTHALREEGDLTEIAALLEEILFLPTPSARRATGRQGGIISIDLFLPTPSARRATAGGYPAVRLGRISTHALREEGDAVLQGAGGAVEIISTHALREEGDLAHIVAVLRSSQFLPTPSARRATQPGQRKSSNRRYFYPRPPRGGRPRKDGSIF